MMLEVSSANTLPRKIVQAPEIEQITNSIAQSDYLKLFFTAEDAEKSRNNGNEDEFRIMIAKHSESPKLSSLRWYPTVDLDIVYRECCKYALEQLKGKTNSVIESLINALKSRQIQNILSFERVIEYLGSVLQSTSETDLTQVIKERYYELGLCSDSSIVTNNPSKEDLIKKIKSNHDVIERLENLEGKERQSITNYISSSQNKIVPRNILSYYKTKDIKLLASMDLKDVEECLKTAKKTSTTQPNTDKVKTPRISPTSLGAQIVFNGDVEDTKDILDHITSAISGRPDNNKPDTISVDTDFGTVSIKVTPATSTIAEQFTDTNDFGGILEADVSSPADAIKEKDKYAFTPFDMEYLNEAISDLKKFPLMLAPGEKISILERLNDYLEKRNSIVPFKERLQDTPMLQVLSEYTTFKSLLDSYDKLLKSINDDFPKIWDVAASNAKKLVSIILSLDNIYIVGKEDNIHAIPTSLNPMYLWKYIKLSEEILLSRGVNELDESHLSDDDKSFIIRKSDDIPDPLSLMLLPSHVIQRETSFLPLVGRIGCMPIYSLKKQINQSESGEEDINSSLIRYLCLYPHAGMMLRVCFIDPPSVESVVEMLKSLNSRPLTSVKLSECQYIKCF